MCEVRTLFAILFLLLPVKAQSDDFPVETEVLNTTSVRLSWEGPESELGESPERFHIKCSSTPEGSVVETDSWKNSVDVAGLEEGTKYTCEVTPFWENNSETEELKRGISEPFLMEFSEKEATEIPTPEEEGELETEADEEERSGRGSEDLTPSEALASTTTEAETECAPAEEEEACEYSTEADEGEDVSSEATKPPIPEVTAAPLVHAEATGDQSARISWDPVDQEGVVASRYRVVCQAVGEAEGAPKRIEIASTMQTSVVIETFTPDFEYACSVYAIWDDLMPGIEVVALRPGVSNNFVATISDPASRTHSATFTVLLPFLLLPVIRMLY